MNPYDQSKKVAIFDLILNNSKPSNNHTPHFDISKLNGYSIVKLSYKNPPDMGYPYIIILKLDHGNDYDYRNNGYNQINLLLNNSSFTLVLFECLMIGWFIPKSIAIMFESIKLLIDSPEGLLPSISSQESGDGCKIVRMPNIILPNIGQTPFRLAMPNVYKCSDPVTSYRQYYLGEKSGFARWKTGNTPAWWRKEGQNESR